MMPGSCEMEQLEQCEDERALQNLMDEFGIPEVLPYLKDSNITFRSLRYIEKEDLSEAVPPIGLRAELRGKLLTWKKLKFQVDDETISVASKVQGWLEASSSSQQSNNQGYPRLVLKRCTHQLKTLSVRKLNNSAKAEMDRLFFTRCAKVGSESLAEFLEHLQQINNFSVDKYGMQKQTKRQMKPAEQAEVARRLYEQGSGTVYIEHIAWIDFNRFNMPKPIYINLVRDPVERVISWYYYIRNSYRNAIYFRKHPNAPLKPVSWFKKSYNHCVRSGDMECQYVPNTVRDFVGNYKRQTLFFCGHNDDCLPFNSPLATRLAMRKVEEEYAVVGTWEETNITLTVLEHYIPRYFAGATTIYDKYQQKLQNRNRNNRKPQVDADVRAMVRRNFTNEYDFYYFCKQRLYKQYIALKLRQKEKLI